ncbi:hypothetical protein U1Q18_038997 [Sarracenia purpurea var. burkii]
MVGILTNSLAVTTTSYRYSCQNHPSCSDNHDYTAHYSSVPCFAYLNSDIKSNRRRAGSYGLKISSMSKEGHEYSCHHHPSCSSSHEYTAQYSCVPHFNRSHFGSHGLKISSMPKDGRALSGVPYLDFPRTGLVPGSIESDNSFIVQQKITSVEFGLACEEGDKLIRKEADLNQLDRKLPPRGSLSIQLGSDFGTSDASESSTISKGTDAGNENRIYFLEERNEMILSERILRLSRSNKIRSAMELFKSMEYSCLRPSTHACNSLISCLLRNGMLDEALRIFKFMKTSETITGHTYSLVLKAIANARGCDAALNIFDEFESHSNSRKDFDAIVYNTMISVCGKENNWVQILRIWRSMKDNGLTGTAVTYRLLVCIFVRCGQSELAIDVYHEMLQSRLDPGDDAMQAIIGACSKEGKWDFALNVFESMLKRGLKPNLVTCNALINTLGKDGKVNIAFRVYGLMKSLGHKPDAYTWNALLGALYRANRHANALQLFERIKNEQNSPLNSHLYNTCLMSCQRLGLWVKALQLMWEMETSELPISTASYNLVIGACEVARKPKIALQVYEHMIHQKCAPDTFTLLSLIRGCVWGSLWHEVEEILNQTTPDASLYNAAIQGMCLRGKIDLATKLYTKMRKCSLKTDGKTRALMLQSLPKSSLRLQKR